MTAREMTLLDTEKITIAPVELDPATSAIAVLDLSKRCDSPDTDICFNIIPGVRKFLDRAREADMRIVFTSSLFQKGRPDGDLAEGLGRVDSEPLIYPDAHDKMIGGELQSVLSGWGVKDLVLIGSQTNVCIMYTATGASRNYKYSVVIPVDGTNAYSQLRYEYALYQLSVLPPEVNVPIRFTTLDEIGFGKG